MAKGKEKTAGVSPKLVESVEKLLQEVVYSEEKNKRGKPIYTLTDKMKVIAAATKLEAIRLKAGDDSFGSGFSNGNEGDDDDPNA